MNTLDRFDKKVRLVGDCYIWIGAKQKKGYGIFWWNNHRGTATHYVWELHRGPVPEGMQIDHSCFNTACVYIGHLRLTTQKQNAEHRKGANKNSLTGIRGISAWGKNYIGTVMHHGVRYRTEVHPTPELAGVAVEKLRSELFTHDDAHAKVAE